MTVMAEVTLPPGANLEAFNNFANNQDKIHYFDPATRLYQIPVPPGNQGQLDGQLVAYTAGQAGIDQAFADFEKGRKDTVKKNKFDANAELQAVVAWVTDEINTLRALHALPDLQPAAVAAAIHNKIDNP
jgi:hypothetical protein